MSRLFSFVVALLFVLGVTCGAGSVSTFGQTGSTGALTGTITDPQGGVVPGVAVSVISEITGEVRTTVSQDNGSYLVPLLLPGAYRIKFIKDGFKVVVLQGIRIVVTETARLDVNLELATVPGEVTVITQVEQLETTSSALGTVTSGAMVSSLPLVSRNFTQIMALSPGVAADVTDAGALGHGNGGLSNGQPVSQGGTRKDNNTQIDGVAANDLQQGGAGSGGIGIPNPDAIEEFKVQTGLYDAGYGGHAGANVNLVTKSGGNKYHGTVFEYLRNDVLNANDFFRNSNGQPRQVLKQNQFGFAAGGPIQQDKLLFFTSYQGTRQRNGVATSCSSNFNSPALTNDRTAAALGALYAGQTGAFGGTAIAADGSNISPQALALLNLKLPNGQFLIPTPQSVDPTKALDVQGLSSFSIACPFTEDQFITNADFLHTQKSKLSGRFFFANTATITTLPVAQAGSGTVPGSPRSVTTNFRTFSLTHTYIFSANLVNEATLGYHRIFSTQDPKSAFTYADIGASAPEPGNSFPVVFVADSNSHIGGNGQSTQIAQNSYDVSDSLFYMRGKHSFHFGGGVERNQDNFTKFHYIGVSVFLTFPDLLLGLPGLPFPGNNGTPFSNIIESLDFFGQPDRAWRVWNGNLFAQDDIKLTSRLTVNVGFRYDRIGDLGDELGRNASFDFSKADPNPPAGGSLAGIVVPSNFQGTIPAGVTQSGNNLGMQGDGQNTLNPRVGFAWQLPHTNRFVLRGGYGMFHSPLNGQPFLQMVQAAPFGLFRDNTNIGPPNSAASFATPFQPAPPPSAFPLFIPYSPTTRQSFTTFAPNYRPPRITRYGLNLQTQLARDLVLEVGFVGARGEHLLRTRSLNQAALATAANPIRGETTNTLANVARRAPLLGFSTSTLQQIETGGASWYNALEVSLNKRFSHGLQFLASYTFSKDLATDALTSTGANGGVAVGDQNNPRARYGPDQFIRPHRFILSYVYQLPSPKQRTSFVGELLGSWQISGVTTIQSGHNLTLVATNARNVFGINGFDLDRGNLAAGCSGANLVTSGSVQSKLTNYFNASCFVPFPVVGSDGIATGFGNSGVGIVRGPDQNSYDISLSKRFPLAWGESKNLEFRAEFFNAFNHPQFADPSVDVTRPGSAGQITATSVAPRILQLALKLNF